MIRPIDDAMRRPLVVWCMLFAAGIGLQGQLDLKQGHWLAIMAVWTAACVGLTRAGTPPRIVMALLIVAWGGWWCTYYEDGLADGLDSFIESGPVVLHGVVVSHPESAEDRTRFVLRLREASQKDFTVAANARVRVTVVDAPPVSYGDVVQVRTELRRPNPATNPGAFDYRSYLRRQGITATAFVAYPRHFNVIGAGRVNIFMHAAGVMRRAVQEGLAGALPSDAAAVAAAVVLGDRGPLPAEVEEQFRRAGVGHLLAVSGLHVGFLATVAFFGLRALRGPPLLSAAVAIVLSWTYVLATGARPPAVRAGVTGTFGLIAIGLNRRRDMLTALGAAAVCLLMSNPLVLFDVSFQLSFAATSAIMVGFTPLFGRLRWLPRPVASAVAVTGAAQIGVLPLLAATFQQLSLVGFVGSVIGSPIVSLLVPVGMMTGLLYHIWRGFGMWVGAAAKTLVVMLKMVTERLAALPWALVDVPRPSFIVIVAWWTLAWLMFRPGMPARRRRRVALAVALMLTVSLWTRLFGALSPPELLIMMLDVGQGDAIFIRSPDGVTALVDGGGNIFSDDPIDSNPGHRVIVPYLRHANVVPVDVVVNTHPHEDHLQGLLPVLDRGWVRLAVDSGQTTAGSSWEEYMRHVSGHDIVRWIPTTGDVIRLGKDTVLQVLHPSRHMSGTRSDLNNNSVVLRVVYGETSALLTGDIEAEAQLELLKREVNLRADVLKVPHHGSRWALVSAFYEAVEPDVAVITVGRNNYGHPAPEVLDFLVASGVDVYRTDLHGAVTLTSDGRRWNVRTAVSSRGGRAGTMWPPDEVQRRSR